jgi:acetolactate synthase-1/2/3 large subunit
MRPVLDGADVILAVGTHFSASGVAPEKTVVHLDVDPAQVGKHHPNSVPVIGDAAPTLVALLTELQSRGDPRPSRAAETTALRATAEEQLRAIGPAARMVEDLRAAIPDDGILVPCTTTMGYMSHMHFPVYAPRSYISTSFMGTLGFGFPAALGAKVACPDKPVVCVTGDGGFLFAATELATAVQYGINTVTVVFNDSAYGNSNRDQRERFGGREYGTELRNPDFAKFAESFGADGVKLKDASEVGSAVTEAIGNNRPTVIEVPMDRLPSVFA